ncbi:unnamed protein product [Brachionus calyciflorus]|uniref:Uncharacterized protein n=1 Tax=Brachionus calyciflorus TaxID=104777 RepID=A0A813RC72_9BILA|nr:unnamed protein product [Brachionus calyciflorus]
MSDSKRTKIDTFIFEFIKNHPNYVPYEQRSLLNSERDFTKPSIDEEKYYENIKKVTKINLKGLDLSNIPPKIFNIPTQLNSQITHLFKYLKSLDLSHNKICELESNIFHSMPELIELNLSYNEIIILDENLLEYSKKLQILNLNSNKIKEIAENFFQGLEFLEQIHLRNQKKSKKMPKTDFDIFKIGENNLKLLDVSSNKIGSISPLNLIKDKSKIIIKEIRLYNNEIKSLLNDTFYQLVSLESINLNSNEIEILENKVFSSLSNLKELFLSKNKIKMINKDFFSNLIALQKLDLSSNKIEKLDVDSFKNLKYLIHIDFSFNEITTLSKEIFSKDIKYNLISFKNNKIDKLDVDIFDEIKAQVIDFRNNLTHKEIPMIKELFQSEFNTKKNYFLGLFLSNNIVTNADTNENNKLKEFKSKLKNFDDWKWETLDWLLSIREIHQGVFQLPSYQESKRLDISFKMKSSDSIISLIERNDYTLFKSYFSSDTFKNYFQLFEELNGDIYREEIQNKSIRYLFEYKCEKTIQFILDNNDELKFDLIDIPLDNKNPINTNYINILDYIREFRDQTALNHSKVANIITKEWKLWPIFTYYFNLIFYVIILIFYSINIEISVDETINYSLYLASKIIVLIGVIYFSSLEIVEIFTLLLKVKIKIYVTSIRNWFEVINYVLCIVTLFLSNSCYVKSVFYSVTILLSYCILVFRLDNVVYLGPYVNAIREIIKKSLLLLLIVFIFIIGFLLSFRGRRLVENDPISSFNTTFEFSLVNIFSMSIGNLDMNQMGIDNNLNAENLFNFLILSCFIVIVPLLLINIFTAISMDEIQNLLKNSEDQVAFNRIYYITRQRSINIIEFVKNTFLN